MKYHFRPPKWLFAFSLFIIAAQLIGQNTKNSKPIYRYALKAYLTVLHEDKTEILPVYAGRQSTTTKKTTDVLPTFGFSKRKKNGSFYEFGLTHLRFQHNDDVTHNQLLYTLDSLGNAIPVSGVDVPSRGAKTYTGHIGLRFEWNYPIFKEKLGRFQPFLGISTDPSVFYQNIEPYSTATFPTIYFDVRNTVSIIPRIQVSLSERLFLDLNVPISMFSSVLAYRYYGNPILPTYARRTTEVSTNFFPSNLNIRLGLAYRI